MVRLDEVVLRTVLDPDHLTDGKLAPAAIALKDIMVRGWSVDRKFFTSPWRIRLFHRGWKKRRPDIKRFFVLPIPVRLVRQNNPTTGDQDFVVTDTALLLNPAHAGVLLSRPQTEGAARRFRNDLLRKLPPYVELREAFSPTDKYGYGRGMLGQLAAILRSTARYVLLM